MHAVRHMHAPAYTHNKCACMISSYRCNPNICAGSHPYIHIFLCIPQTSSYLDQMSLLCMPICVHVTHTHTHVLSGAFHCIRKGVSADADPHYQKLYGRVTDVCSNRKSQPSQGAMKWPRLGRYPSLIRYAPPSGKYAATDSQRWLDLISFT